RLWKEPKFSGQEVRVLEALAPFIAHAIAGGDANYPLVDSDDSAMIVVSETGAVQQMSREAGRLLLMAQRPSWSSRSQWSSAGFLPVEVMRLCSALAAPFTNKMAPEPPVWRRKNEWGEFVFRAYWLDADSSAAARRRWVGITIHRREPLPLKM